jgi:hypothetical protein
LLKLVISGFSIVLNERKESPKSLGFQSQETLESRFISR